LNKIIKILKVEDGKALKLFFRGKPLRDEDTIIQHSIVIFKWLIIIILFSYKIEISNNDVILYMLIEEPKQENSNLEVSVLASNMNSQEVSWY